MSAIDLLGLVAAVAFGLCAVPQAVKSYKDGITTGMSRLFLTLWSIGEICMLSYVSLTSQDPYLLANYVCNGLCLSVIVWFYLYPRNK